ncbi:hypothetical protein [Methylobacterium nonmethylotrophicum]|uniref:Uncharacterized protein n=1 Tax=Methylobacterium nonmethylotrophicum TaxID=1141884 RepID=A0A4Z0NDL0_9HYPH|nr:hypothetical protein [Methylobacterium nonmethylotrophicum]TGD91915.1 hypothetical protein EU555_35405 [Methylobacterium nonmethylotrophicum]
MLDAGLNRKWNDHERLMFLQIFSTAIGELRERGGTIALAAQDWLEATYAVMEEIEDNLPGQEGLL